MAEDRKRRLRVIDTLGRRLAVATVSACTCATKTNDPVHHWPTCRYRLFVEADQRITQLETVVRFYASNWYAAGEDGECGLVPNFALTADAGQKAREVLSAPGLGYLGLEPIPAFALAPQSEQPDD